MSVYPRSASSASFSRWVCSGPGSGTVIPGRIGRLIGRCSPRWRRCGRPRWRCSASWRRTGGLVDATPRPYGRLVVLPEPDDAALAGGGEQRAVLGEHVDEAVAEPALHGVGADVEQHPLGRAQRARRAGCCRGCCRRRGRRAPARRPSARSRRGSRAPRRRRPRCTSGMRDHRSVCPSPGVPSRSSNSRPLASRWSSRWLIVSPSGIRSGRFGQSSGRGTSGIVSN